MPGACARMSLIEEGSPKQVRMANLAIVGSHSVNGVAAVHSELVKTELVPDFYALWPEKIQQQDQRRDAAALAAGGQPRPGRPDHRRPSATAGRPTWTGCAAWSACAGRRGVPGAISAR